MDIGKLGVFFFCDAMTAAQSADFARRVESLGYGTLWFPEAVGREAMASASWLLASTKTLNVATGIANVYARDAMTMASAANTLAEQSGGRFVLGIGVSHKPMVEDLRGHAYDKPLSYMRGYLERMEASLYTAVMPATKAPVVIGALHPRMLELAAAKTRGAHPYLMSPGHTAFARKQIGKDAWLCPEQKVMLESDGDKARGAARRALGMYFALPNYQRALKRFDGFTDADFENGGSDRLVDACVVWGDEQTIRARIEAHRDAGADHVCIQPVHPDGLPEPDWRVLEALAPARA
jgi:probable F420-dependent oxidoreductase